MIFCGSTLLKANWNLEKDGSRVFRFPRVVLRRSTPSFPVYLLKTQLCLRSTPPMSARSRGIRSGFLRASRI